MKKQPEGCFQKIIPFWKTRRPKEKEKKEVSKETEEKNLKCKTEASSEMKKSNIFQVFFGKRSGCAKPEKSSVLI